MSNAVTKWFDETESEVLHRSKEQNDFTIAELKTEAKKRGYVVWETRNHYIVVRDSSTFDDIEFLSPSRSNVASPALINEIAPRVIARAGLEE